MFGRSAGHRGSDQGQDRARDRRESIDVWLSPAHGASVSVLAHQLEQQVHLVVVPKTGSRRADIAVLSDPDLAELEGVAQVLPGTPLLAALSRSASPALRAAAERVGARMMTAPSAAELLEEIRRLCRRGSEPALLTPA